MARKRSDIAVWGAMIAGVLLCTGVIGYGLNRPARLVPVLQNVDGKHGNRKYGFSVKYYWLTPDSLLVWRGEDRAFVRFDLRSGTQTVMKQFPNSLIGVSPDGRYLIGMEPDPPIGKASLHNHLIAVAVDGTATHTWNKVRDLFFLPSLYSVLGGKYGFVEKRINISGNSPSKSKLFRVSLSDFDSPLQAVNVPSEGYVWCGTDNRNRLLAWDPDETSRHSKNGTVQFSQGYYSSSHSFHRTGKVSHLAVAAFPFDSKGEPIDPNKPERFLVRLPPVNTPIMSFTLSPDGRKVAWMTMGIDPLPQWLSWFLSLYYRWKQSRVQLWVSDLSDAAIQKDAPPRLVFEMDWDPTKRKPIPTGGQGIPAPGDLAWTPDGNHLTFLDNNTLWRVSVP